MCGSGLEVLPITSVDRITIGEGARGSLTKRIQETDRYMRRQAGIEKNSFMGRNLEQKTVGLIGWDLGGNINDIINLTKKISLNKVFHFRFGDDIFHV